MSGPQRRWYPLGGWPSPPQRSGSSPTAARKPSPIDPLTGPKLALAGRVVTMDDAFTVKNDAVVYIDRGAIVAVQDRAQPPPAGFEGVVPVDTGGTHLPGLDRAAQPPQLQRAAAVGAGAEAVPAPRPVAGPPGLPQADQRPDDGRGRVPRRPGQGCAARPAGALRRVQVPAGRRHHQPGRSCSAATPACSASTAASCATSSRPTIPTCPRPRGASPTSTPRTPARSWRRLKKEDSCFLLHLSEGVTPSGQTDSVARRHFLALQVAPGRVGAQRPVRRHPRGRPVARGLRRARAARRLDDLVAAEQPAALRRRRRAWMQPGAPACASAWAATGRPRAARTCSAS